MSTCDHVTGICVNPSHQGIGGEADLQWFAARRRRLVPMQEPACRWAHGVVPELDSSGLCPVCAEDDAS